MSPVPFVKNTAGTPDSVGEHEAIDRGFASWNRACSVNYVALTNTTSGEAGGDSRNVIVWVNTGWAYGAGTIAVTFTYYNPNDGEIGEADTIMNGDDYFWTTSTGADTDVESITAHEAGHFLGLDHSSVSEATMNATVEAGETKKRSLHSDDIAGGVFLYGAGSRCLGCRPARSGLDPAGDANGGSGCGCVIDGASGAAPRGGLVVGAFAVLAVILGSLARRRMAVAAPTSSTASLFPT